MVIIFGCCNKSTMLLKVFRDLLEDYLEPSTALLVNVYSCLGSMQCLLRKMAAIISFSVINSELIALLCSTKSNCNS